MGMFFSINCWLLKVLKIWLFPQQNFDPVVQGPHDPRNSTVTYLLMFYTAV